MALEIERDVPLAPLTTLELGGPAKFFVEVNRSSGVTEALDWARARGVEVCVLGGGSNMVVADAGFDGLVLRIATTGVVKRGRGRLWDVAAGEVWNDLVAQTVVEGCAGLECLGGIPGRVGATPIQNVGAYGQDVSETIQQVRALDRRTNEVRELDPSACGFAYRHSAFRSQPGRWVVLSVTYALEPGGRPAIRYGELERALAGVAEPSLQLVHDTVVTLRRKKSMLIDPADDNRRSAGSFFTNPIVDEHEAARVVASAVSSGIVESPEDVPRYPAGPGRIKLAAGWLIERAGIHKGYRSGNVGVSSQHALALVHHGGGTTAELIELARYVRDTVKARFGVTLCMEPVLVGEGMNV